MSARPLPLPVNPALLKHAEQRRKSLENRVADQITRFAGSMTFVYLHIIWFAAWILSGVEHYPYGLLTMIVSLEAIFLSTFVMISQNRADEKRQVLADHQWQTVQEEEQENQELLQLSNQILDLTRAIHQMAPRHRQHPAPTPPDPTAPNPDPTVVPGTAMVEVPTKRPPRGLRPERAGRNCPMTTSPRWPTGPGSP
jgi:uncharacterized membrane protein